jgi:hypothetical protein
MHWSDIDFDPPHSTLRHFAWIWLAVFGALGGIRLWQGKPFGAALIAVAVIVGVAGSIRPPLIRLLFVGLTVVTFPIGWLVSRVILGAIYFGIFTPLAIVFRLMRRDALRLRRDPEKTSYWIEKRQPNDSARYLQQF